MSLSDLNCGDRHSSTLQGSIIKVHGLNTYVVEPSKDRRAKGIIVIVSDAFGLESVNNRLLADAYATKGGYKVYLPDFMLGQYAAESPGRNTRTRTDKRQWRAGMHARLGF